MRVIITTADHGILWERPVENGSVTISKKDQALLEFLATSGSDVVIHVRP